VIANYVDTSALLRLVYRHGDYSLVDHALHEQATSSALTRIEARVSILRRWHNGELSRHESEQLIEAVEFTTFDAMRLVALDGAVLDGSITVAERFPLRTLDSLHVASAVLAERRLARRGHQLRFCTADQQQADAAAALFGPENVDLLPPWR
jgi:predicted nucleic acid-binding protein